MTRRKNSPSGHHCTTLSGYIFATKACIDNRKKTVKQQYLPHMSPQYGELRPTSGWDRFVCLGHPSKFQRLSRLGSVTARYSSSGRQPNFAVLNRGRHLYSAGRSSRWASAHILVYRVSLSLNQYTVNLALFSSLFFNISCFVLPVYLGTRNNELDFEMDPKTRVCTLLTTDERRRPVVLAVYHVVLCVWKLLTYGE